ncbi:MAG: hypothetical protein RJB38_2202 [Pseudomonadota bacterium]
MNAPVFSAPPLLFVIAAPSGAGKTSLCERLLRDFPTIELSVSTTTRAPRGQEVHGKAYWFTTREAFESQIHEGKFVEWALVHGNYYGTSKVVIEESLARGVSVLLDIDVQGAEILKQAFSSRCVTIFVAPPNLEELEKRLRNRGTDPEEAIQRRMTNAVQEINQAKHFDFQIINDDFEGAYAKLREIVMTTLGGKV